MNQVLTVRRGAYDFETLTVGNTVKTLTATKYDKRSTGTAPNQYAQFATVTVETDSIRYRTDGGDPAAGVGHLVTAGSVINLSSPNDIRLFKALRVTNDATIQVSYAL